MNLILVGYRGSGKSTIGTILAKRLGWSFLDLDTLVAQRAGLTISQIFAQEGQTAFRQRERDAFFSLRKFKNHVIALGGGAPLDPDIRTLAKRMGKVVWLRAPAVILWTRINRDQQSPNDRPDLTEAGGLTEVEALLPQREPLYRSAANHTVDTFSGTAEESADAIEIWYQAGDFPGATRSPSKRE